ncbi:hypothetical protein [Demetria terragena]|uniref:hypothetical protein n=1 Tax=Demetria terragena TaxID=63959 RepID=UPI00039A28AE|nr:hypothetical protein [Demetria terragena]
MVESSTASSSAAAYRLQVDALEKAPDSVYTGNVTKADGIVYFLRYTVTNNGGSQSSTFDAGDVNGFMLKPKLGPDQEGKKFVSAPGCDSDDTDLAVGESGKGCDAYIAKGAEIKDVVFAPGSRIQVSWTP